ncbi:MAG: CocE/NonD family hydrolase [Chloroflexota bacterium]
MPARVPKELKEIRKYGDEEIEVIYRKTRSMANVDPSRYYPPLMPRQYVEEGIHVDQDVPVPLRDGTIIYADVYRPEGVTGKLPAILGCSPMGKRFGYMPKEMLTHGVPPGAISKMARFEGPDPAFFCHYGYAIVNPDARGSGNSGGDAYCWGTQEGRDCADIVEWVAARDWCTGKVGMSGNSWLAMVQWLAAAEKPPHLACIAPWEGTSDIYREFVLCGGFPEVGFNDRLISRVTGGGRIEDYLAMAFKYPLMNAYWEDKIPRFEEIEIPAYITGGWSHFHLRGSIEGYRRISSAKKWLRVHRDFEWPDFHDAENLKDLILFFDRYLKDIRNGWELTPRVRIDIMDAGDIDYQVKRPEREFPLARTQYRKYYLDAKSGTLSPNPVKPASSVSYDAKKGTANFTMRFDEETELTGYLKIRLWVEAKGNNDMDLFITVQKLDDQGEFMPVRVLKEPHPGFPGKLRVSHRELDEKLSTDYRPVQSHRRAQLLKAGEIVPVDIEIWPTSMIWHPGQQLRVVVSGHYFREPGWFEPFAWETLNKGTHIIHTGGKYDSYLQVPVIPTRYQAGSYIYR